MSTKGNRDFRPAMHYTPPYGWINDPNGLTYENGVWHLFAQHNPNEPVWGPMHWLHATSTDLLHWKDHGIAMYPDEKLGMIFSGSAVIDHGNTSGFGEGCDPMVLIYTSHGEYEQQSIAYSNDRFHFTPYEGNPVIANNDKRNFRDPKVFRNEKRNCWSMVLAAGDHADFYASKDLIHWEKTGEFGAKENRLGGIFECTDVFPMTAPDGSEIWVLIVSMALHSEFGGGRMQYFLGQFDGDTFVETIPAAHARILDSGYDNYAAVTFFGTEKRLMIGWASSPSYANAAPTGDFCCLMTYVRELSLVDTDAGLQLSFKPLIPEFELKEVERLPKPENLRFPWRYIPKAVGTLPGELFQIHIEAEEAFDLVLSNEDGEALHVLINNEQSLVVDRSRAGAKDFDPVFGSGVCSVMSAPRKLHGPVKVDLYFDRMIAEVFTDNGTVMNTSMVFPNKPYTKAELLGNGTLWIGTPKV
ncbi:MAG: glycoside hydrolase family 32 protein [Clostridia bacterium]|nr:glycoside hydrolase family 32 protein [Clostridia bacterium]